jgi:hypothetical protein
MSLLSFDSIVRSVRSLPFLQRLPRTGVRRLHAVLWRDSDVCCPFRPPPVVPCQPIPRGSPLFCVAQGIGERPWRPGRYSMSRLSRFAVPGCITRGVRRPPRFLNQPCVRMPRSLTPAGSMRPPPLSLAECGLPPNWRASASHDCTTFQGSMTQPAYLLPLCFTVILTASRAEFATGLPAGVDRVGLAPTG